jgi:hypothetical protein
MSACFLFPSIAEALWVDETSIASTYAQANGQPAANGMDRASRNELVKTIETQKEQLQQYKAKLRGNFF